MNFENVSVGRLGLALLRHSTESAHKLILYKTKEQILSSTLLTDTIQFHWKASYLQFHDDLRNFWSLSFSNNTDSSEVLQYLKETCSIEISYTLNTVTEESEREIPNENEKSELNETNLDLVSRVAKIGLQLPKLSESKSFLKSLDSQGKITSVETLGITPKEGMPQKTVLPNIPQSPDSVFTMDNPLTYEFRMHNAELRMHLLKLDTKMDRVVDNIERLQFSACKTADNDKEEDIIKLEERILEVKKENRYLKLQMAKLEHEKQADSNISATVMLQKCNEGKDIEIIELKKNLEELETRSKREVNSKVDEIEKMKTEFATELDKLRQQIKEKEMILQKSYKESGNKNNNEVVLGIMNHLYVQLYQNIDGKGPMETADLLKLIAEIIRKETKTALNQN